MPYRPHALDCPRRNTATISRRKNGDGLALGLAFARTGTAVILCSTTADRCPDLAMSRRAISRLAAAEKSIARRYAWDIFSFCCSKRRFYRQRLQFAAAIRTHRQREHIGADEFRRYR